ncbi:20611_t:CDS:2, partial [Dentiscutata erythropus]
YPTNLQMEHEDNLEILEGQPSSVNLVETVDPLVVGQTFNSWESEDNLEIFEEQSSSVVVCDQNLVETVDSPAVGQTFNKYNNGVCRSCRYACEYQGCKAVKKKTNIVENQWETQSKCTGYRWQIRASCPKTTGILSINSLCLSHNDHSIKDETNRFAVKYHAFTKDMLNDIKFWTKTGNITMRTQYQMLINRVFTAKMQSTQCVEGQNAIIKNSVNGNTSLINLAKHIDEQ